MYQIVKINLFLLLLAALFVTSCSENLESESPVEAPSLLIENLSIVNGMYVFTDLDHLTAVEDEMAANLSAYQVFAESGARLETPYYFYSKALKEIDPDNIETEADLNRIKAAWFGKVQFTDEMLPLFNMTYKNILCNLEGLMIVGDQYYQFNNDILLISDELNFDHYPENKKITSVNLHV